MMCGGCGIRLDVPAEKPFVDICGRSILDQVVMMLRNSSVKTIRVTASSYTPNTRDRAADFGLDPIGAPGGGHISDLRFALARVSRLVIIVVLDPPLMVPEHVDAVISATDDEAATACVPVELRRGLGASVDDTLVFDRGGTATRPTGLGVVGPTVADATIGTDVDADMYSAMYLSTSTRLVPNVNRPTDIEFTEDRCE